MNSLPLASGRSQLRDLTGTRGFWLLLALVFFIYLPGIVAEPCLIDDVEMLAGVASTPTPSLTKVFIPGSAGGGYYRPLIHFSFLLDKSLWLLDTRVMHLENILFNLFAEPAGLSLLYSNYKTVYIVRR